MARQKIGEYKAKKILFDHLGLPYHGLFFDSPTDDLKKLQTLDKTKKYVVKVDQGIKKRFKLGLVKLAVKFPDLPHAIKELQEKGYTKFLIEEYREHKQEEERYLALQRTREGLIISLSKKGGVDIEDHKGEVKNFPATSHNLEKIAEEIGLAKKILEKIIEACDLYHFSFLEINPLVVTSSDIFFLDLAVEVDSAGAFFVQGVWNEDDFVGSAKQNTKEEDAVEKLSSQSQASFRLVVLNPDGALWMLLSGGGASIVVADEVYNQGQGKELANYGEYSGNPNAQETYIYTKNILSLLIKSGAQDKALIIAGGVANFTDIRVTFRGIIKALEEVKEDLQKQKIKVFVRRGGPYQEEGLSMMKEYLNKNDLLGFVAGPEIVLTEVVTKALLGRKK